MRLYAVTRPDYREDQDTVIVSANGREQAKRTAKVELSGDSEKYIVEPLPAPFGGQSEPKIVWRTPEYPS